VGASTVLYAPMADTPLLELRNITKSYGSVQALSGVDFECRAGEVMAMVGDNGAGKSTLIKILAGVVKPTSGEILVRGRPVAGRAARRGLSA